MTGPPGNPASDLQVRPGADPVIAAPICRTLVVDDDPDINQLVRLRLVARGFQVDTARSGDEALALLSSDPPDLMFLDVSMPGTSGLEVLEQVRARGLDLRVIMMTAFGSEEVAIEALRRGADDYLRKPFGRSEFQLVLNRTIGRLYLGREIRALQAALDEQRRQLAAELARAAAVQAELLPATAPPLGEFELAARCRPAREVGGDFYDWYQGDGRGLTFTLGDVMGKGMPAALLMATIRAALRAVGHVQGPTAALRLVGQALGTDLARSGAFATLFHAQLDPASGRLRYVDAGHGHLFVRQANGQTVELGPRGLPLGLGTSDDYQEGGYDFAPGDALVLYSDGLVDARPELRLTPMALAAQLDGAASAREMIDRLMALTATDQAPLDDLTAIVVRRTPTTELPNSSKLGYPGASRPGGDVPPPTAPSAPRVADGARR